MKTRGDKWIKQTEEYMKQMQIDYDRLRKAKKEEIKEEIRKWDTEKWKKNPA